MRRAILPLLLAAAMVHPTPAAARVPEKTPKRLLEATVRRTLSTGPAAAARPAVVLWRGGRPLLEIDPGPVQPASLLKLATTVAAMEMFGPDHRFRTRVAAGARVAAGTVAGPLFLIGGGDPTLSTSAYRAERFVGKPKPDDPDPIPAFEGGSATVEDLAAALVRSGLRRVAGDIVADGSRFDAVRTQSGWPARYLGNDPEVGYLDALTVNEGFADPEANGLLPSPSLAAGEALRAALVRAGVTVTGRVRAGVAPRGAATLAEVRSPPMTELIFYTNRWSINYAAEYLLKNLGAEFGGGGTTTAGAAVIRRTLTKLGIPVEGLAQADGSGLSLDNRMSPGTVAALLERILRWEGKAGDAMRASMATPGEPGTLFKRMRKTPAAGNLWAKTGTIRNVRALAGWVTPADGVPVVFVVVFNGAASAAALTSPLDLLGISFTRYPRG